MTRVTIDAATLAKFQGLEKLVEVCDEAGRIIGHFYPGPPRDAEGKIIVPFSDEEIHRRLQERTGRPLKDILNDLQKS
ncbi:MAG: hypothetical protein WD669_08600 [Pirellulales bacterium]